MQSQTLIKGKTIQQWKSYIQKDLIDCSDSTLALFDIFADSLFKFESFVDSIQRKSRESHKKNYPKITYRSKSGKKGTYFFTGRENGKARLMFLDGSTTFFVKYEDISSGLPEEEPKSNSSLSMPEKIEEKNLPEPSGSKQEICKVCGEPFVPLPNHPGYITHCLDCQRCPFD